MSLENKSIQLYAGPTTGTPTFPEGRTLFGVFSDQGGGVWEVTSTNDPSLILRAEETGPTYDLKLLKDGEYEFTATNIDLVDLMAGMMVNWEEGSTGSTFSSNCRVFDPPAENPFGANLLRCLGVDVSGPDPWPPAANNDFVQEPETWPQYLFVSDAAPDIQYLFQDIGGGNYWAQMVSPDVTFFVTSGAGIPWVDIAGSVPTSFSTVNENNAAEVTFSLVPPTPPRVTVPYVLRRNTMPRGQQQLLQYAKSVQAQGAELSPELEAYESALQASTAPSTRTAVAVQATATAEQALRRRIGQAVLPVQRDAFQARAAKSITFPAPSITGIRARAGVLTFQFGGNPKQGNETWFQIQIWDRIDDEPNDGEDIDATRSPFRWVYDLERWGGKTVFIRGRWVVKTGDTWTMGPYTPWKKVTLPEAQPED